MTLRRTYFHLSLPCEQLPVTTHYTFICQKFKNVRPISYPKKPILFFVFVKNKNYIPRNIINDDDERNMWFDDFCFANGFKLENIKPVHSDKNNKQISCKKIYLQVISVHYISNQVQVYGTFRA